jgi:hypothetical protein
MPCRDSQNHVILTIKKKLELTSCEIKTKRDSTILMQVEFALGLAILSALDLESMTT